MTVAPNKYPATEEKTTLIESLILVISVKFLMRVCGSDCDWVTGTFLVLLTFREMHPALRLQRYTSNPIFTIYIYSY